MPRIVLDRADVAANGSRSVVAALQFLKTAERGIAAAGSGVWVAARPFAAAGHRGGTLTEVTKFLPGPDPAQAYGVGMPELATVYDGLVAFRETDGALGGTLVPDLAVTLPRPAGGGTAYTFTLRPGIRYSNGTPVRASDFRRGIQRQRPVGQIVAVRLDGALGEAAPGVGIDSCKWLKPVRAGARSRPVRIVRQWQRRLTSLC